MADNVNDNEYPTLDVAHSVPDAHGQAAMLLVESLIHGLIARSVITVADALDVIDVAADVKAEIGLDLGDTPATLIKSLALLQGIHGSLAQDLVER